MLKLRPSTTDWIHVAGAMSMLATAVYVLSRYDTQYPIELVILGFAMVAYLAIRMSAPKDWLLIRYIDWFVTVPLLVYVVSTFGNRPYWALAVPVVLMLLFGYLGVLQGGSRMLWLLGFAAYLVFFGLLATSTTTLPEWLILVFFATWALYGAVDFLDGPYDSWAYTALDVINKPLFIILLLAQI